MEHVYSKNNNIHFSSLFLFNDNSNTGNTTEEANKGDNFIPRENEPKEDYYSRVFNDEQVKRDEIDGIDTEHKARSYLENRGNKEYQYKPFVEDYDDNTVFFLEHSLPQKIFQGELILMDPIGQMDGITPIVNLNIG